MRRWNHFRREQQDDWPHSVLLMTAWCNADANADNHANRHDFQPSLQCDPSGDGGGGVKVSFRLQSGQPSDRPAGQFRDRVAWCPQEEAFRFHIRLLLPSSIVHRKGQTKALVSRVPVVNPTLSSIDGYPRRERNDAARSSEHEEVNQDGAPAVQGHRSAPTCRLVEHRPTGVRQATMGVAAGYGPPVYSTRALDCQIEALRWGARAVSFRGKRPRIARMSRGSPPARHFRVADGTASPRASQGRFRRN
jgi:hypothetical protein